MRARMSMFSFEGNIFASFIFVYFSGSRNGVVIDVHDHSESSNNKIKMRGPIVWQL